MNSRRKKRFFDHYFSTERAYKFHLKKIKDFFFNPIAQIVAKFKITPDSISYTSILFSVIYFFLVTQGKIKESLFFLALGIFLDGLDGALARTLNSNSPRGAFIDFVCDQISTIFFIASLPLLKIIPYQLTLFFTVFHIIAITMIFLRNILGLQNNNKHISLLGLIIFSLYSAALKPRPILVFFFILYLFREINLIFPFILIALFLTLIETYISFIKLKDYLATMNK